MADNIFENLTDEEQNNLWMYMIFNKDKIIEKTEQWTKEAEKAGMTLIEYLESINPLGTKKEELPIWLGNNCKDCGNEKCKKLGTVPKGYDCALWATKNQGNKMSLSVTDKEIQKLIKKLGYKGCKNCQHQIAPLRMCKWAEQGGDGHIHFICPKWSKKGEDV